MIGNTPDATGEVVWSGENECSRGIEVDWVHSLIWSNECSTEFVGIAWWEFHLLFQIGWTFFSVFYLFRHPTASLFYQNHLSQRLCQQATTALHSLLHRVHRTWSELYSEFHHQKTHLLPPSAFPETNHHVRWSLPDLKTFAHSILSMPRPIHASSRRSSSWKRMIQVCRGQSNSIRVSHKPGIIIRLLSMERNKRRWKLRRCMTSTHLRNVSFSSFNFSASFALNFISRSTIWPFSVWAFRSFSSSDEWSSSSARYSSRSVVLSSLSSLIEVVSIWTSALRDRLILCCSMKLPMVKFQFIFYRKFPAQKTHLLLFPSSCFCSSETFTFKSIIICWLSLFRLCISVSSSCLSSSFFSSCCILPVVATSPNPRPLRSFSFSTDNVRFSALSWWFLSRYLWSVSS